MHLHSISATQWQGAVETPVLDTIAGIEIPDLAARTRLLRSSLAIARDPDARAYTGQALTPGHDDDVILDLLTKTTGTRAAVAHLKKIAGLTGPGRAA